MTRAASASLILFLMLMLLLFWKKPGAERRQILATRRLPYLSTLNAQF
jgi:hypothetical protein